MIHSCTELSMVSINVYFHEMQPFYFCGKRFTKDSFSKHSKHTGLCVHRKNTISRSHRNPRLSLEVRAFYYSSSLFIFMHPSGLGCAVSLCRRAQGQPFLPRGAETGRPAVSFQFLVILFFSFMHNNSAHLILLLIAAVVFFFFFLLR